VTDTLGNTVEGVGKGVGNTLGGVTSGVGNTVKATGNTVKGGTDKVTGAGAGSEERQNAGNPLGL
jgi:predicted small secreted protein